MSNLHVSSSPFTRLLRAATGLFVLLTALNLQAADTGRVAGSVVSKSTGNALQGAIVSAEGRSALSDESGHFVLYDLPAGSIKITASYSGFKDLSEDVVVTAGAQTAVTLTLNTSDIVQLEAFTVQSVKEGQALSVTEQRNAGNPKTVVALDEWGVLPTQNIGELAARLPGVTFTTDEDDLAFNVSIRGQPDSYTRLNIDGMSSTGVSGIGRTATLHSFSASSFEAIEIIAGQTPDKRADSLGGQLNLKTRSPLAMKERSRVNYSAAVRYHPSWADRNASLAKHPSHPDFSLGYTGVYDVFGGTRNLGISLTTSYQEVVNPIDYDFLQYQFVAGDQSAYFHDYDKRSGTNHRFLEAFQARADYRWSDSTTVSLRFLYNAGQEPYYQRTRVNPFSPRTISNGTTGAIVPTYTANRTEVLPVTGVRFDVNTWDFSFLSKNPTGTLAFEHNWDRLKVDHAYRWSFTRWHSGHGRDRGAGEYQSRINAPIGFILDNTDLDGKVFTQTAGPSIFDPASYSAIVVTNANTTTQPVAQTSRVLIKRDTVTLTNEVSGNVNASYDFETKFPLQLKVGLDSVNRRVNSFQVSPRRWYGVVGTTLTTDLMDLSEFERQNTAGVRIPAFKPSAVSDTLGNTALWYEDVNFNATAPYTGRRLLEEGVDAAFAQVDATFGKLRILGGVRGEWVKTETFTYFRQKSTLITDQPDHYKRAAMDFRANILDGKYSKSFPSVHLTYTLAPNLKARASYSTSYGRPTLQNLIPGVTPNDTAQTVTVGNPELRPQLADNVDFKLDYYFKNSGKLTAGVYRKKIKDYIGSSVNSGFTVPSGADNGFDGLYSGYTIIRASNLGDAKVEGLELDYSQRLSMLPGALKGLTVSANYTYQRTEGRFAGTTVLNTNQVAGFVPRLFNARLQYNYKKFGASADVSFKGKALVVFSTTAGANRYQADLTRYNLGFSYRWRPQATFFLNFDNITEAGPEQFFEIPLRVSQRNISPTAVKFGVTGTF